ncbi:MAG: hypothetical protein KDC67_05195 [Ignavibacteriae bacterium]|nr:hypothetical protein [Ignavibacteriota bacterium]
MIIKKDEGTGQLKFICEFSQAEFVRLRGLVYYISQLIDSKTEELEELINENCHNIRLNRFVSFEEFNYDVNMLIIEIAGLVDEYNQCNRFIEGNGL